MEKDSLQRQALKSFYENFSKAIIKKEASLFIGAGVSMDSKMPSWKKLMEPFIKELGLEDEPDINLLKVAQYYKNTNAMANILTEVREKLENDENDTPLLNLLLKQEYKSIWTTNYDRLIEKHLQKENINFHTYIVEKDLVNITQYNKINLYKINGDIGELDGLVLTQEDFENYKQTHSLFLTFLKRELVANTFLFVGYSFNDRIILECLHELSTIIKNSKIHYALIYIENDVSPRIRYELDDLKRRYNIEGILVNKETIQSVLEELNNHIKKKKIFISGSFDNITSVEEKNLVSLIEPLIKQLYEKGYIISSGLGKGLGEYIAGFSSTYSARNNIKINSNLSMRPLDFNMVEKIALENRKKIMLDCNVAIYLFGQNSQESDQISKGVLQEFEIAKENNIKVIPLGYTGYASKKIWLKVKNNLERFPYLINYIDELNANAVSQNKVEIILNILDSINKGDNI